MGQSIQDVGLSQRQSDLAVILVIADDEILNLQSSQSGVSISREACFYLIAPEKCVSFLPLGVSPYGEELLWGPSLGVSYHMLQGPTYFNSPGPHMACDLLCFGPLKGSADRAIQKVSRDNNCSSACLTAVPSLDNTVCALSVVRIRKFW